MTTYVKPMKYIKTEDAVAYQGKDEPMPGALNGASLENKLRFVDIP